MQYSACYSHRCERLGISEELRYLAIARSIDSGNIFDYVVILRIYFNNESADDDNYGVIPVILQQSAAAVH